MSWEMLSPKGTHADPDRVAGGIPAITPEDVKHALGGLKERPFLFGMAAFLGHIGSMDRIEQLLEYDLVAMAEQGRWGSGKDRHGKPSGELTRDEIHIIERMGRLMMFEVISARSKHDTYAHEDALPEGTATVRCPLCRGRGKIARASNVAEISELEALKVEAELLSGDAITRCLSMRQRITYRDRFLDARQALTNAKAFPIDEDCKLCHSRGRFLLTAARRAQMVGVTRPTWYRRWEAHYTEALSIPQRWEAIAVGHVRKKLKLDG